MPFDDAPFAMTPWVRRLLVAMAAVYLLQITVFTSPWIVETFGFIPSLTLVHPWSLLTYAFLHGSFLHITFNAFTFFMFGRAVEARLGGRSFVWLYVVSALGGALLSLALEPLAGDAPIIGASAAIFGVMLAFVLEWPDAQVMVFPVPFPFKAKWLMIGLVVLSLWFAQSGAEPDIAHFAHLGGLAAAFLYLRGGRLLRRARVRRGGEPRSPAVLVRPDASGTGHRQTVPFGPTRRRGGDATPLDEVNRVLDKISARGLSSLTPEERKFLDEVSKRFKQDS